MKFFVFALACLGFATAQAEARTVTLEVGEALKAESIVANYDGSVTVIKPNINYGGEHFAVFADQQDKSLDVAQFTKSEATERTVLSAKGVCALIGKKQVVELNATAKSMVEKSVELFNSSGSVIRQYLNRYAYLERVTCK